MYFSTSFSAVAVDWLTERAPGL